MDGDLKTAVPVRSARKEAGRAAAREDALRAAAPGGSPRGNVVPLARVGPAGVATGLHGLRARVHPLPSGDRTAPATAARSHLTASGTAPADEALARDLIAAGLLPASEATAAEATAREMNLPLARVLLTRGRVAEGPLLEALSRVHHAPVLSLPKGPPDPRVARVLPRGLAIRAEAVPWRSGDGGITVATARPDLFDRLAAAARGGAAIRPALATRADIIAAQTALWGASMAREAETRAPVETSCRAWNARRVLRTALFVLVGFLAAEILFPAQVILGLFALAGLAFVANVTLKTAAFVTTLRHPGMPVHRVRAPRDGARARHLRPPVVSIVVALYQEAEVAERLVVHLSRLRFPAERLDILLMVEADDTVTTRALAAARMPANMRVIPVPPGHPRTKPRALNYALPFAHGEILGIYDAEDRPDPNQIAQVLNRFDEVPANVACLQGRLDYYNADHNLMSRLFTVEYASWFRVLLPGVQRMGLFVPLGGTTLFLRRDALEKVGGWDAHNVTEDAELGLRLARAGYRTELVETTTFEEANAAPLPWIRQRSRWLKGYLITWATAMRHPVQLWRDLGTWRFLGLQAQMPAAVLGFFLAPLLWSLAVLPFGVPHPLDGVLSREAFQGIGAVMMLSLAMSIAVSVHACAAPHLQRLRIFAPLVEVYYALGTFAAWIGAYELTGRPFFWAKTRHGVYGSLPRTGASDDTAARPPDVDAAAPDIDRAARDAPSRAPAVMTGRPPPQAPAARAALAAVRTG